MNLTKHPLDHVFQALADPTRRAVLERLSRGTATVKELADPFGMALPSFLQHLKLLEQSGLVTSTKKGRVRTVAIARESFEQAEDWLAEQRIHWESRLDRLDDYLRELNNKQDSDVG